MARTMKKTPPAIEEAAQQVKAITIVNAGPIEHLNIPIPSAGVVVLRGNNGCGKSTAIKTAESILNGGNAPGVTLKDGSLKGHAEGLGVRINFARSRNTRTGELEAVKVEHSIDLAGFIDPGISSPEAADRARIKSLANLAGVKADLKLFDVLHVGDDAPLDSHQFETMFPEGGSSSWDLIEMAAQVKRRAENKAREFEESAKKHKTEEETYRSQAGEVPADITEIPSMESLHESVSNAIRHEDAIHAKIASCEREAAKLDHARKGLAELPESSVLKLEGEVNFAQEQLNTRKAVTEDLNAKLDELQKRIKESCEEERFTRSALHAKRAELASAVSIDATRKTLEDFIASSFEEPPTAAEVNDAANAVADARLGVERATAIRRSLQCLAKADNAKLRFGYQASVAAEYRAAAAMVEDIVTNAIHADGLKIIDGRLTTKTERGQVYFADLSHGERTRIAMMLGLARVGTGGLLVLPQEYWEGLDGIARKSVDAIARQIGVVVLTAKASDAVEPEPIHAEVYCGNPMESVK
ncbi:OLD family protein [Zavarzinella formosa]|uniref:hypothetical protein n=1 Tax=Zavarzinella formosa TaxID=360055 RepID=UPI000363DD8E|nr:hypothetical protein [Zavarzinella formosa]